MCPNALVINSEADIRGHMLMMHCRKSNMCYMLIWIVYVYWIVILYKKAWNISDINGYFLRRHIHLYTIAKPSIVSITQSHNQDNFDHSRNDSGGDVTFKLIGRLGNRMYEYAGALGIAYRNGLSLGIPRGSGLFNCFGTITAPERDVTKATLASEYHPQDLHFSPESFHIKNKYTYLNSLMQSWKYFGHVDEIIRREFIFHEKYRRFADDFLRKVDNNESYSTFITVQVRRTDFVKDYKHMINGITLGYIKSAMEAYSLAFPRPIFIVVSDDIPWCKANLPPLTHHSIHFSESHDSCEDLSLLTHANHSIISAGSSYGWWGAYLANGHVTYYPGWLKHGGWYNLKIKEEDFYLPRWTKLPR